jgi:hypothetical protein
VTPDAATAIVWLSEAPADARSSALLSSWARERGLSLVSPSDPLRTPLPMDIGIAASIEDRLESARDALVAGSAADVDRALGAAEDLLAARPQLPNAAWLMAEVERARSVRWRRIAPTDPAAADRAWSRAEALDGGRTAGPGEQPSTRPETATLTPEMRPSAQAQVWLDGAALAAGPFSCRAGPHALVVTWQRTPIWASWIELPPGASTVTLSALDPPACSSADLSEVRLAGDGVSPGPARCAHWVAAAPGVDPGAIRIATCEGDQCSTLADWRPAPAWSRPAQPEGERRSRWPAWATWGLVGTGVAVATGVVVVAIAVSSSQSSPETRLGLGPFKSP